MRIRDLHLTKYGKFSDRSLALPASEKDIHLIVGPNEAGKSTIRQAIRDWLFGIPTRTPMAFLHAMPELLIGGSIERTIAETDVTASMAFNRTKGNKDTLRSPKGEALSQAALLPWLGTLQAEAFERMYALDHQTLREGSAGILSASDDLGRMLLQSAAGIEHLGKAFQALEKEADDLWSPRKGAKRAYYIAQETYDAANGEFKSAALRTRDWKKQHDQLAGIEKKLGEAKAQREALTQHVSHLERIRRVRPLLAKLTSARERLETLRGAADVPRLPDDAHQRLDKATTNIALAEANILRLEQDINDARAALEGVSVDRDVLAIKDHIEDIHEQRLRCRSYTTDLAKLDEQVRIKVDHVRSLARDLGWSADSEDEIAHRLPHATARSHLAKLIQDGNSHQQQLETAEKILNARRQQLERTQHDLKQVKTTEIDVHLQAAYEAAMRFADHGAKLEAARAEIEDLTEQLEREIAMLGAWQQPLEGLRAMAVPDEHLVHDLIERSKSQGRKANELRQSIDDKSSEIARLEAELNRLVRDFQPVSRDDVLRARSARDVAWQAIKRTPQDLIALAPAFESGITEADQLADRRLDRAQHEAERQSRADTLESKRSELRILKLRQKECEDEITAIERRWTDLTAACGLPDLPLEIAPSWLSRRKTSLQLATELATATRESERLDESALAARDGLLRALPGESSTSPAPALDTCLQRARTQIEQANQALGQVKSLEKQLRDAQSECLTAEQDHQTAKEKWDTWLRTWEKALAPAKYAADTTRIQVEDDLKLMQEIDEGLKLITRHRIEQIEPMKAEFRRFVEAAQQLAERGSLDSAERAPETIALELKQRLEGAKQADAEAARLNTRIHQSQESLRSAKGRREDELAALKPMMEEARVDDVSALGQAIERSDQLKSIELELRSIGEELVRSSDGLSEEDLRKDADAIGADELIAKLNGLMAESNEAVQAIATLSTEHGAKKAAFDAIDGTDLAAQADARRQEAIADMADAAERYLQLKTAVCLLKWSIDAFRETKQGPMLSRATAIFRQLTRGSFDRLVVDSDGSTPVLIGIRESGARVTVPGMSEGSRDQLYLALRLAALELQLEQGSRIPLIIDDLFINFDDQRTEAGLQVLGELSRKTQILLLTHHDHLVPLASRVLGSDLNVVRL